MSRPQATALELSLTVEIHEQFKRTCKGRKLHLPEAVLGEPPKNHGTECDMEMSF